MRTVRFLSLRSCSHVVLGLCLAPSLFSGADLKKSLTTIFEQALANTSKVAPPGPNVSPADLRTRVLSTPYTWSDNGSKLGTLTFAPDGSARATWSGEVHYWKVEPPDQLVISAMGTTYVTRLAYQPGDGSFSGARDRTSQVQDGIKTTLRPTTPLSPPGGGANTEGLRGEYFDNSDLQGPAKISRIDPTINFDWSYGPPGPGVPDEHFGARWTGTIQPRFSETYVFTGNRDNGFRLWIDGQLIVDLWNNQWGNYTSRPVALQAGRRHDIKIEYYEDYGGAAVSLKWRSNSQPEEVVPASQLSPAADPIVSGGRPPTDKPGGATGTSPKFDRMQWFATRGSWNNRFGEGSPYDDSAIEIEGDVITLKADRTDQVAALFSRPFALSRGDTLTIKRSVLVHAANRQFEGCLTAYAVDEPGVNPNKPAYEASLFNLGYRNFNYETDQNLFSLSDGKSIPPGPGKFAGGTAPTTTPIWDQWFDEELRYDSGSGETVYLINGQERMRFRAAPLNKPYVKLLLHPYGWNTGHYIRMRGISISVGTRHTDSGGGGTGLRAEYFDNPELRGWPKITRIDFGVSTNWGEDSPGPGIPADNFSVRWTGEIVPRYSENYVFKGYRDDGVRVWIDDRLIIDEWKEGDSAPFASAPVALTAGKRHRIRVEFLEQAGKARIDLRWQSPSQPDERIPGSALYPPGSGQTPGTNPKPSDPQGPPGSFDRDDEGWSVVSLPDNGPYDRKLNTSKPTHRGSGGNPGGYLVANDPGAGNFYWEAPAAFLGDQTSRYGTALRFDLTSEGGELFDEADVVLVGGGLIVVHDTPKNPGKSWTTYVVPLNETGWRRDALKGPAVTRDEFRRILGSLTALRIRGEFRNGAETCALDNVGYGAPTGNIPSNPSRPAGPTENSRTVLRTGQDYHQAAASFIQCLLEGSGSEAIQKANSRTRRAITENELAALRELGTKYGRPSYRPLDGSTTQDGFVITLGLLLFDRGPQKIMHCVFKDNLIEYLYSQ